MARRFHSIQIIPEDDASVSWVHKMLTNLGVSQATFETDDAEAKAMLQLFQKYGKRDGFRVKGMEQGKTLYIYVNAVKPWRAIRPEREQVEARKRREPRPRRPRPPRGWKGEYELGPRQPIPVIEATSDEREAWESMAMRPGWPKANALAPMGSVYAADDPRDPGGPNAIESETLSVVRRWAERTANESGQTVIIWIFYSGGGAEPYTAVHPKCPGCNGRGMIGMSLCPRCQGSTSPRRNPRCTRCGKSKYFCECLDYGGKSHR